MRDYLKKLRKDKRYSQRQLAEAIGLSQNYYGWIEIGERQKYIKLDTLLKLSKALSVPLEALIAAEIDYQKNSEFCPDSRQK